MNSLKIRVGARRSHLLPLVGFKNRPVITAKEKTSIINAVIPLLFLHILID